MARSRARALRILEYEGTLEWVTQQMENRGVKGNQIFRTNKEGVCIIREAIIGDIPLVSTFCPKRAKALGEGSEAPAGVV